jgi:preprotein translocase subunit SecB
MVKDMPPDPSVYSDFLQLVEVEKIEFLEIHASREPQDIVVGEGRVDVKARPRLERLEDRSLFAIVDADVNGVSSEGKAVFHCTFQIRATYNIASVQPGVTDRRDLGEFFAKVNVLVNVWPYLRQAVSYITSNLGVGPVTIGLLKPLRAKPENERPKG